MFSSASGSIYNFNFPYYSSSSVNNLQRSVIAHPNYRSKKPLREVGDFTIVDDVCSTFTLKIVGKANNEISFRFQINGTKILNASKQFDDLDSFVAFAIDQATIGQSYERVIKRYSDNLLYAPIKREEAEERIIKARLQCPFALPFIFRPSSQKHEYFRDMCVLAVSVWDDYEIVHSQIAYDEKTELFNFVTEQGEIRKFACLKLWLAEYSFAVEDSVLQLESQPILEETCDEKVIPCRDISSREAEIQLRKVKSSFSDASPYVFLMGNEGVVDFCYFDRKGNYQLQDLEIRDGKVIYNIGGIKREYRTLSDVVLAHRFHENDELAALQIRERKVLQAMNTSSCLDLSNVKVKNKLWKVSELLQAEELLIFEGQFGDCVGKSTTISATHQWMPYVSRWVNTSKEKEPIWTSPCKKLVFKSTIFNLPNGLYPVFTHFPELKELILIDNEFWVGTHIVNVWTSAGFKQEGRNQSFKDYLDEISKRVEGTQLSTIIIKPKAKIDVNETDVEKFRQKHPHITISLI